MVNSYLDLGFKFESESEFEFALELELNFVGLFGPPTNIKRTNKQLEWRFNFDLLRAHSIGSVEWSVCATHLLKLRVQFIWQTSWL